MYTFACSSKLTACSSVALSKRETVSNIASCFNLAILLAIVIKLSCLEKGRLASTLWVSLSR